MSGTTISSGIASEWIDLIPDNVGKIATLVGICLSLTLIYIHIRKGNLEIKRLELENEQHRIENYHLKNKGKQ